MACEDPAAEDIIRTVMSNMRGADEDFIATELRNVLNEFFNESRSWIEDLTLNLKVDKDTYDLSPVDDATIVAWVHEIWNEIGLPVRPTAHIYPHQFRGDGAMYYTVVQPSVVKFFPVPTKEKVYVVHVSKQLKSGQLVVPDYINTHFRRAIMDGLLGRMYDHSDKPYADAEKANRFQRSFRSQLTRARDIASRGFTGARADWQYPSQFAQGSGHLRQQ